MGAPIGSGATAEVGGGYGVISPRFQARRPVSAPLATLILALLLVALTAPPARAATVDVAEPVDSPPQLLLIHGGSFLFEDPTFEAETAPAALAAGFVPHYLTYPLGDLRAAILAARAAARDLRARYGPNVYAYGSSAGGTLAALLAGEGLLAGAVAKAPPTDLVGWDWPLTTYGADYYDQIAATPPARYRFSPLRRPQQRPLLVVQGGNDRVVPAAMNEAFAAKFARVHLWLTPGGHHTEKAHPWVLERSLAWLGNLAADRASPRFP